MKEKIALALDVATRREALHLVNALRDHVGMFKVGLQMFTAEGPGIVREIVDLGGKVFLDLKFHDIPNTVRRAAVEAGKLGVSMMTIHAAGGRAMLEAVTRSLDDEFGGRRPLIVGITVLTSLNEELLSEVGVPAAIDDQVIRLARLAGSAGLDGVVCSPREIRRIRGAMGSTFKIVTPGIRATGQSLDDQERTATAAEAVAEGADFIVVGRAVTSAPDPRSALEKLIQSV